MKTVWVNAMVGAGLLGLVACGESVETGEPSVSTVEVPAEGEECPAFRLPEISAEASAVAQRVGVYRSHSAESVSELLAQIERTSTSVETRRTGLLAQARSQRARATRCADRFGLEGRNYHLRGAEQSEAQAQECRAVLSELARISERLSGGHESHPGPSVLNSSDR